MASNWLAELVESLASIFPLVSPALFTFSDPAWVSIPTGAAVAVPAGPAEVDGVEAAPGFVGVKAGPKGGTTRLGDAPPVDTLLPPVAVLAGAVLPPTLIGLGIGVTGLVSPAILLPSTFTLAGPGAACAAGAGACS